MTKVTKRTGEIVDYDISKIKNAIMKANESAELKNKMSEEDIDKVVSAIDKKINQEKPDQNIGLRFVDNDRIIHIESVQDLVINNLKNIGFDEIADLYTKYRLKQEIKRIQQSDFMSEVRHKIKADCVVNQNANLDEYSFGGRKGEADSELMRMIALYELISDISRINHIDNMIYIHDFDSYAVGMHNCDSIPFDHMLKNDVKTRQVFIRAANSLNTAFQVLVVYIQLQSLQQFGGCAATHLDWTMVPYVRKSFYKHYKTVSRIASIKRFLRSIIHDEIDDLNDFGNGITDETPIMSDLYRGKHWWNFKKRFIWRNAMIMLRKEAYQAVEGMYHNLNSLQSRSGKNNRCPIT